MYIHDDWFGVEDGKAITGNHPSSYFRYANTGQCSGSSTKVSLVIHHPLVL